MEVEKLHFVDTSCSIGFIKEVVYLLNKYDLSHHFIDWCHTGVFVALQRMEKETVKKCVQSKKSRYWTDIAISHESISNVSAFVEITFGTFCSITYEYPDLVPKQNLQL